MSRFTRKKRSKKTKEPKPTPAQSSDSIVAASSAWNGGLFSFHVINKNIKKIDLSHLEKHGDGVDIWRYKPGSFLIGGGHYAKPSFLLHRTDGSILLDFVVKSVSDDLLSTAGLLQLTHPWFLVRVFCGDEEISYSTSSRDLVDSFLPKRPIGDVRDSMSAFEREHCDRLDDWKSRGLIRGWLYEPAAWSIGFRCSYSPDFLVYGPSEIEWHEVKGHHFKEDSKIKLKIFASLYPFFNVRIVQRYRDKGEPADKWRSMAINSGEPFGFR